MRNETLLGKLDRPVENTFSPFLVELIPPDSGALVESLKSATDMDNVTSKARRK